MRQVGIIAAAGIFALENNINLLEKDHENAEMLACGLSEIDEMVVDKKPLQTNMVFIQVPPHYSELQHYLSLKGIIFPKSRKAGLIRLVTHLEISRIDIDRVIYEIKCFYSSKTQVILAS